MLKIKINKTEHYDNTVCRFIEINERFITLEHSLASLALWESKWHKPFLSKNEKTTEETLDYIKCMVVDGEFPENIPIEYILSTKQFDLINDYISNPMTATWFNESNSRPSRDVITSERIYYWMTIFNIPFECQYWHLNRLLTLIRVCSVENAPKKKMSKRDIYSQNRALNAARRSKSGSRG